MVTWTIVRNIYVVMHISLEYLIDNATIIESITRLETQCHILHKSASFWTRTTFTKLSSLTSFVNLYVNVVFNEQRVILLFLALNITFIFGRCRHSSAVMTPVKHECDLNNLSCTFAKLKILLMGKLTNRASVTPAHIFPIRYIMAYIYIHSLNRHKGHVSKRGRWVLGLDLLVQLWSEADFPSVIFTIIQIGR